jgi:hypothetical protein
MTIRDAILDAAGPETSPERRRAGPGGFVAFSPPSQGPLRRPGPAGPAGKGCFGPPRAPSAACPQFVAFSGFTVDERRASGQPHGPRPGPGRSEADSFRYNPPRAPLNETQPANRPESPAGSSRPLPGPLPEGGSGPGGGWVAKSCGARFQRARTPGNGTLQTCPTGLPGLTVSDASRRRERVACSPPAAGSPSADQYGPGG